MTSPGRQTYINRRKNRTTKSNERARWALIYLGRSCLIILFAWAFIWFVNYRKANADPAPTFADNELMHVVVPAGVDAEEIDYDGFHVSFNPRHHVPNYVSWQLTKAKVDGKVKRKSNFAEDPDVPGCATLDDYRHSGYDRGHMAPAGDMKWSEKAMKQCHFLTNVAPQNHDLNNGVWNAIEQRTRDWVLLEDSLIIISGPVLTDDNLEKIGSSGVTVPRRFFKIIMAPNTYPPMILAFMVDNRDVEHNYEWYTTTVDKIEDATGMDFFSSLSDPIETKIERSHGLSAWKNYMRIKQRERNL